MFETRKYTECGFVYIDKVGFTFKEIWQQTADVTHHPDPQYATQRFCWNVYWAAHTHIYRSYISFVMEFLMVIANLKDSKNKNKIWKK